MTSTVRGAAAIVAAAVTAVVACGGPAQTYAGQWSRHAGTGADSIQLAIDAFGKMSLWVPAGDSVVTMSGRGDFRGDTLIFRGDSSGAECQRMESRYRVRRDSTQQALTIDVIGEDRCPGRGQALPGRWTRRVR